MGDTARRVETTPCLDFQYAEHHADGICLSTGSRSVETKGSRRIPRLGSFERLYEDALGYSSEFLTVNRTVLCTRLGRRAQLRGKSGSPKCMVWRPHGDRLLCGLASGEVASFSTATMECEDLKRILAATREITAISPSKTQDVLVVGDGSGKLHFAASNFAPLTVLPPEPVFAISGSPTDTMMAVGVKALHPLLIDVGSQTVVGSFTGLGFETSCLQWHPRRSLVAAGARTNQVQLWDPRQNLDSATGALQLGGAGDTSQGVVKCVASSFAHKGGVQGLQWHPTNDFYLLTCAKDQLTFWWDIRRPRGPSRGEGWQPIHNFKITNLHSNSPPIQAAHINDQTEHRLPFSFASASTVMRLIQDAAKDPTRSFCSSCFQSSDAASYHRADFDVTKVTPTALAWHPQDPNAFVIGDSAGLIHFWSDKECIARVDNTLIRSSVVPFWAAPPPIDQLLWHPTNNMLVAASGPISGINGTVSFWTQPPRWSHECEPGWCANSCHLIASATNEPETRGIFRGLTPDQVQEDRVLLDITQQAGIVDGANITQPVRFNPPPPPPPESAVSDDNQ